MFVGHLTAYTSKQPLGEEQTFIRIDTEYASVDQIVL